MDDKISEFHCLREICKVYKSMYEKGISKDEIDNFRDVLIIYMNSLINTEETFFNLNLLRHRKDKKIRCILRQDKTLKIVADFIVSEKPLCELKPHQGSEKMFMFIVYVCSEELLMEKFVIKLGNADKAKTFKKNFDNAQIFNQMVKEGKEKELVWAPIFKDVEAEN